MSKFRLLIEQKPYLLALLISFLVIAWMLSGSEQSETETEASQPRAEETHHVIPKVEVTTFVPEPVARTITLYGRTEPNQLLALSSELEGRVVTIAKREGEQVKQGDIIVELDKEDRLVQLKAAKALVEQRELEYQGAVTLTEKGLQDASKRAAAKASLELAKAQVAQIEMLLQKSTIRAPFDGVLNQRRVEVGSYVRKGDTFFDLVDLNPLVVHADVTEHHIQHLNLNNQVQAKLLNGQLESGKIRYLSSVSNQGTNTFEIEVTVDNQSGKLKAGVSTELTVFFAPESAIKVSPALLSLDESGNLGVKTVVDNHVTFTPIDMVKAEPDGVWLAGFEENSQVITVGQGFVRPGDEVIAVQK